MLFPITKEVSLVFNESGFSYSNCLLIDDDVRLLVDSGAGNALQDVDPEHIDILLMSHHHIDHIRGNAQLTNAQITAHPLEAGAMNSMDNLIAATGWQELMGEELALDAKIINAQFGISDRVDSLFSDEQIFNTGHNQVQVMHTPGHSAGHCAFWVPEADLVFLGDICLSKVGPWYGGPEADIDAFVDSINKIIALNPGKVSTGHINQVITENTTAVLTEYRDRILKREQRILNHLRKQPSDIHSLANYHYIYRVHTTPFVLFWEKYMIKKHLERLIQHGMITEAEPGLYQVI